MSYSFLVERNAEGYRATAMVMPDASVTAPTRDEALQRAAEVLRRRIASAEIVEMELPPLRQSPLEETIGLFSDAPEVAREICAAAYAARDAEPDDED